MNLLILLVVIIIIAILFGLLYKYKLGGDEKDDLIQKLCEDTDWIISKDKKFIIHHKNYILDGKEIVDASRPPRRILDCTFLDNNNYKLYLNKINSLDNAFLLYTYYTKKYPGNIKSYDRSYISIQGELPNGHSFVMNFKYTNSESSINCSYCTYRSYISDYYTCDSIDKLIECLSNNKELKIDREELYQIPTKVPNITLPDTDTDFDPLS